MIHRLVKLPKGNSFFLFGARGTGKTSLIKEQFSDQKVVWIDLLQPREESLFRTDPHELDRRVGHLSPGSWVVIDEVQRAPDLLDLVHHHIEKTKIHFALTGSSARGLRRAGKNLLAGRAYSFELYPFTHVELGEKFDLQQALEKGSLPKAINQPADAALFLEAYAKTYLMEEIAYAQVVRNLVPFQKFLRVAAQMNNEILNYSKLARDIGVDTKTVQSYFDILEDTLVGYRLEGFHTSARKRVRTNPKFFFFDTGIKRVLDHTLTVPLQPGGSAFGKAFEHLVVVECIRLNQYLRRNFEFTYLRTKDDAEIDLVIERPGQPTALVEIKSTDRVSESDATPLKLLAADIPNSEPWLLSRDPNEKRLHDHIRALEWREGLKNIFAY